MIGAFSTTPVPQSLWAVRQTEKVGEKMQQQCERGPEKVHHGKSLFFLSWTESGENDASKFSDLGDCTKIRMFALGVDNEVQFDVKDIFQ